MKIKYLNYWNVYFVRRNKNISFKIIQLTLKAFDVPPAIDCTNMIIYIEFDIIQLILLILFYKNFYYFSPIIVET